MVHIDEVVRLVGADEDIGSDPVKPNVAPNPNMFFGQHRCWRVLVELVVILYAILLLTLGIHMCAVAPSPDGLTHNPLSYTVVATPVVWAFVAFVVVLLLIWLKEACWQNHLNKSDRYGCSFDIVRLLGNLFPVLVLAFLLMTPATACVRGTPKFPFDSSCLCNHVVATGGPLYQGVPAGLTLAFVGDSGVVHGDEVLRLIRNENASAVVFNGDTNYMLQNREWMERFRKHLGKTPFYVATGSHETSSVRHIQEQTAQHWHSIRMRECRGEIGFRNVCTHHGVGLLLNGVTGSCGSGAPSPGSTHFFEKALSEFAQQDVSWPICIFGFHSNRELPGHRTHAWDNYKTCLNRGALIVSSHERRGVSAHELVNTVGNRVTPMSRLPNDKPFGNLGAKAASLMHDGHSVVVFTGASDGGSFGGGSGPSHGAFFCHFHVQGNPGLARCFYKDVEGRIANDFFMRRPLAGRPDSGQAFV